MDLCMGCVMGLLEVKDWACEDGSGPAGVGFGVVMVGFVVVITSSGLMDVDVVPAAKVFAFAGW